MTETTDNVLCRDDEDELRLTGFSDAQIEELRDFLRPFCLTARLYFVRLFLRARRFGKRTFEETIAICRLLYENEWKFGTPERIGDPDDVTPPDLGMKNTCLFLVAYQELGMPIPKFLF